MGLKLSTVTVIGGGEEALTLGEPLLFKLLSWLALGPLTPEQNVILHPVAFAGWIGLLVTALNLIPVGQLDGGHVAYALFPEYHRYISLGVPRSSGGLRAHILARLADVGRAPRFSGLAPPAAVSVLGAPGPAPPGAGDHHHRGVRAHLFAGALCPGLAAVTGDRRAGAGLLTMVV